MNKIKTIFAIALLSMLFGMNATAEKATTSTLEDAFKNGKFSGKAQAYYEAFEKDGDSYAVATLKLKYETAKWNNLQLGAEAYAASQLFDHGQEYVGDFDTADGGDNTPAALSEIYLKYYFSEKSLIQAGRWNHKKVTRGHFEDSHSEGVNIQYNDIDNLSVNAGIVFQTGEFDYDDFENYGDGSNTGDADFNDADYGDASPFVLFLDAEYQFSDAISVNPYLYFQGDYATVFGSDLAVETEISEGTKVGFDATVYAVETDGDLADNAGDGSVVAGLLPWIKFGDLRLGTGVVHFTDGVVRPRWFNDYITGFDQENPYSDAVGSTGGASTESSFTAVQATVEYKFDKFKARYGVQQWDGGGAAADEDGHFLEHEFVVGYKFTKALDAEVRYFVTDSSKDDDYDKVEARLRFKF